MKIFTYIPFSLKICQYHLCFNLDSFPTSAAATSKFASRLVLFSTEEKRMELEKIREVFLHYTCVQPGNLHLLTDKFLSTTVSSRDFGILNEHSIILNWSNLTILSTYWLIAILVSLCLEVFHKPCSIQILGFFDTPSSPL